MWIDDLWIFGHVVKRPLVPKPKFNVTIRNGGNLTIWDLKDLVRNSPCFLGGGGVMDSWASKHVPIQYWTSFIFSWSHITVWIWYMCDCFFEDQVWLRLNLTMKIVTQEAKCSAQWYSIQKVTYSIHVEFNLSTHAQLPFFDWILFIRWTNWPMFESEP